MTSVLVLLCTISVTQPMNLWVLSQGPARMVEHGVEVCPLAHDYQVGMTDKLQHNWYLSTVYVRLYPRNTNMYTPTQLQCSRSRVGEHGSLGTRLTMHIYSCMLSRQCYI